MPREAVKSPSLALLTAQPPESQTEVSFEVGAALNEGTGWLKSQSPSKPALLVLLSGFFPRVQKREGVFRIGAVATDPMS